MDRESDSRRLAGASAQWRRHRACVDYRAWLLPLPAISAERWPALVSALSELGLAEPDATGVTTVRGAWGFLIIPPIGFPELRLNCYKNLSADQETDLLTGITARLKRAQLGRNSDEQ
ncbi:hypothetical protein [Acidihalobacter prosperus]